MELLSQAVRCGQPDTDTMHEQDLLGGGEKRSAILLHNQEGLHKRGKRLILLAVKLVKALMLMTCNCLVVFAV